VTTALPAWAADADTLERIFHAALSAGDAVGIEHALTLMALCDPRRAERLHRDLGTALHIAAGGEVRVQIVPATAALEDVDV